MKTVLTIAGSDSGGGAGIQADLKTFTALKVFGCSVVTCVTAQNTVGVQGVFPVPSAFVKDQLASVFHDIGPTVIKTGMLFDADIIKVVAAALQSVPNRVLVVDPVMVATTGASLLSRDAAAIFSDAIVPLAYVITPNLPEALVLIGDSRKVSDIKSIADLKSIAVALSKKGPPVVVLKGGHIPFTEDGCAVDLANVSDYQKMGLYVYDLIYRDGEFEVIRNHYIFTQNTHGTGCTLSAAITAHLALGLERTCLWLTLATAAIKQAIDYVHLAIEFSFPVGAGAGPLNHFHGFEHRMVPTKSLTNPFPFTSILLRACADEWREYVHHPFVLGIKDGSLPRECFEHFIKQDFHYLLSYARAHGIGVYKAKSFHQASAFAKIYCKSWGISIKDMQATKESMACVAYTRYVIDIGHSGKLIELQCALAPCLLGYGDIGRLLYNDPSTKKAGNPYWSWVENYAKKDFQDAVALGRDSLEEAVAELQPSSSQLDELIEIFRKASRLEFCKELGLEEGGSLGKSDAAHPTVLQLRTKQNQSWAYQQ
ncbi:hypothetical protein HDU91_004932 [Kappamyces sp. JEL0680]|nr:hypothetical protein HDU91_004932 [Kappamyces sp. JEL0680]